MTEKIKILTTDSGLGGLSVTAELVERIKRDKYFDEAEIIFFNCRPSDESGYDPLASNEARARVFSKALDAMYEKFRPDVIMIACNTLSAIYEMTEFAKASPVPVTGIIESGVEEIFNLLTAKPEIQMIMFATPATVSSEAHKNILVGRGIEPGRLHYQDCLNLPAEVVQGPESDKVKSIIESFMKSGVAKTKEQIFGISLLCTHFAYAFPAFSGCARRYEKFSGDIVNPDSAMVASFLKKYGSGKAGHTNITVKCRTHTTISPENRQAVFPLLKKISPDTAQAFLEIVNTPDMFKI
jgi:glutamate racemase